MGLGSQHLLLSVHVFRAPRNISVEEVWAKDMDGPDYDHLGMSTAFAQNTLNARIFRVIDINRELLVCAREQRKAMPEFSPADSF